MAKTITINGVDFTPYFTPTGFSCSYEKIDGGNGGTMKNGDALEDIVAVKARGTTESVVYRGKGATGVEYWTGLAVSFSEV